MAITITAGVGSRGAGEIVQRTTATGATDLKLEGSFATLGVKSVEARIVVSGGSVEVRGWTPLALDELGSTTFKGRFVSRNYTSHAITALAGTNPVQITLAGRHMIEEYRQGAVKIIDNGTPTLTLNGTYTATGTATATILTVPVSNLGSIYQVNGTVDVYHATEVPIARTGIWYNWQIRTKNAAGTVLETLSSTVDWGVGLVFVMTGQSNMQDLFTTVDAGTRDTGDPMVSWWDGTTWAKLASTPAGNGAHRFLNVIQQACTDQGMILAATLVSDFGNIPVGAIEAAADSSALLDLGNWGLGGVWLNRRSGPYSAMRTTMVAATDKYNCEAVVWQQGEAESLASAYLGDATNIGEKPLAQPGEYQKGLIELYNRLRSGPDALTSPVQGNLPFCVSPPVRMWTPWVNTLTAEIGSTIFESAWPVVVQDGLEFSHSNGDEDIDLKITSITQSSAASGLTILGLSSNHGIRHTGPIRIRGQQPLSASTSLGAWQTDINGSWIAARFTDTSLIIPISTYSATHFVADGILTVERSPSYASTRPDTVGSDGLHLTAAGCTTLADRMARSIARRCGIEGNGKALAISAISVAAQPVVTFTAPHGLALGASAYVKFTGTDSTPVIDGTWAVAVFTTTTVTFAAGQITTLVAGTTGTATVPGRPNTGFTLRGPRIVGAIFGDELTGTVAAEQSRTTLTLYVKHDRGTALSFDANSVLQSFEVCDSRGPLAVVGITAGPAAALPGGMQRLVLTVERDTTQTEGIANDPFQAPDRLTGNWALVRYGQFSSLPSELPANDALVWDDAAGLAMPMLPTFGYLKAGRPVSPEPLSALAALPQRSRSFIHTVLAATATATTCTISGQQHATEFWRFLGGAGSRMIRPGDRWFQITTLGVRVNEGIVRRVSTYTGPVANVVLTLDRSVTTTDGNFLLIGNEFDGSCAVLAMSREGVFEGA